jgi:methionyl-tRNA formyltransferase
LRNRVGVKCPNLTVDFISRLTPINPRFVFLLENFDNLSSTKQNEEGITYAKKLKKDEAWIDWRQSADKINRNCQSFLMLQ